MGFETAMLQKPAKNIMRVDMHCHTMYSGDSVTLLYELEEAFIQSGVDVLCICDHGTIQGAKVLHEKLSQVDGEKVDKVIIGEEYSTSQGELIGLFLKERITPGLSPLEVALAIKAQGGLVYVPHPFDTARRCLKLESMTELAEAGLLDIVEVFNSKVSDESARTNALDFAEKWHLAQGAGSDAHVPQAVGAAYVEMPVVMTVTPASFLRSVKEGHVVGRYCDPPRQWRSKVVPSLSSLQ